MISASDQISKTNNESKVKKGFALSDDTRLRLTLLQWMTNKNGSEVAEDAIRLLYAVYSLVPKEIVEPVLKTLEEPKGEKTLKDAEELIRKLLDSKLF